MGQPGSKINYFINIYVLHYFWPTMDLPTLLKKYPRESQHSTRLFEKILKKYIDRRCRSLIWIFLGNVSVIQPLFFNYLYFNHM